MKTIYKTLLPALCCMMVLNAQAQRTFQRNKVLLEKHTGTQCKACPAADSYIETYITETNNKKNVALLRHHSFRGSILNTACSETNSGTWGVGAWPSMLVDRYAFFGAKTERKSYSTDDCYQLRSRQTIETRLKTPTYVSLSLEGSSYNPTTKKLRVVVSGEVTKQLPFLRIHAYVTQDGIVAPQTGSTNNYVHDAAVRFCLMKNADGDDLTLNEDSTYSMTFETTLQDNYGLITYANAATDPKKMKVVAFVSSFVDETVSYNYRDYSTSEVHNADAIALTDLPAETACATPTIEYANGNFVVNCTTSDATCHYDITPCTHPTEGDGAVVLTAPAFTVTAYADAPGYGRSAKVRRTFTLREILGEQSSDVRDVDGDGRFTKSDVEALARKILKK